MYWLKSFWFIVNEGITPEFYTLILTFTMATVYRKPSTSLTGSWPCHSTNTETTSFQAQVTEAFGFIFLISRLCSGNIVEMRCTPYVLECLHFANKGNYTYISLVLSFFWGTILKINLYYSKFQVICTRLVLRAGDITLWMCHSRRE